MRVRAVGVLVVTTTLALVGASGVSEGSAGAAVAPDKPLISIRRVGSDMQPASAPAGAISGVLKKLPAGSSANPVEINVRQGTFTVFSSVMAGYGIAAAFCQSPVGSPRCQPGLDDISTTHLTACSLVPVLQCSLPIPTKRGFATVVVFRYETATALADVQAKIQRTEPDIQKTIQSGQWPSELTPLVLTSTNGHREFMLLGNPTWLCDDSPTTPATGPIWLANSNCQAILLPHMFTLTGAVNGKGGQVVYSDPAVNPVPARAWNMSYDGAFGYGIVAGSDPTHSTIYFVRHNEHQNSEGSGPQGQTYAYPGSVYPDVTLDPPGYYDAQGNPKHCASSPVNGWEHCWISFADFVSLASAPYNMVTGALGPITDLGPILWPSTGYINGPNGQPSYLTDKNGQPICKKDAAGACVKDEKGNIQYLEKGTGFGMYNASMIEAGDYLYAYTSNTSSLEPGRPWGGCYTVARAPKSNPSPSNWKWFYNGAWNSPTLPTGFTKEGLLAEASWLTKTSGKASCLFSGNRDVHSKEQGFNVAKVRGTSWYVGVHERVRNISDTKCLSYYSASVCQQYSGRVNISETAVRYSPDLVHWTEEQVIDAGANPADPTSGWGWGKFGSGPALYDSKFSTSQEVDANDFYILGKQVFTQVPDNPDTGAGNSYQIWSAHVKIKNGPWGPNPPEQP